MSLIKIIQYLNKIIPMLFSYSFIILLVLGEKARSIAIGDLLRAE